MNEISFFFLVRVYSFDKNLDFSGNSFLEMQHIDQVSQTLKTDKNIRADKFCQETLKIWTTEYDKIGEHHRLFER